MGIACFALFALQTDEEAQEKRQEDLYSFGGQKLGELFEEHK